MRFGLAILYSSPEAAHVMALPHADKAHPQAGRLAIKVLWSCMEMFTCYVLERCSNRAAPLQVVCVLDI